MFGEDDGRRFGQMADNSIASHARSSPQLMELAKCVKDDDNVQPETPVLHYSILVMIMTVHHH
jgi:hypothetical protein